MKDGLESGGKKDCKNAIQQPCVKFNLGKWQKERREAGAEDNTQKTGCMLFRNSLTYMVWLREGNTQLQKNSGSKGRMLAQEEYLTTFPLFCAVCCSKPSSHNINYFHNLLHYILTTILFCIFILKLEHLQIFWERITEQT